MRAKRLSVAFLTLLFAATASVAQAGSRRTYDVAPSAGASYRGDDAPWSFACIKDHGPQRCSDLN